jgi:hypothetical protein
VLPETNITIQPVIFERIDGETVLKCAKKFMVLVDLQRLMPKYGKT